MLRYVVDKGWVSFYKEPMLCEINAFKRDEMIKKIPPILLSFVKCNPLLS